MAKNSPEVNQMGTCPDHKLRGTRILSSSLVFPTTTCNVFVYILCCRHRNSKSHIQLLLQAVDFSQDLEMKGGKKAERIKDSHR